MSRVGLKIGLATTLLLLITVATTGAASALTITGTNISVNITVPDNASWVNEPIYVQIWAYPNTTANNFTVTNSTGLLTNATTTLHAGDWFWVNATSPGEYLFNVTNANNTSENVSVKVYFVNKATIKFVYVDYLLYADAKLYKMKIQIRDETWDKIVPWAGDVNLTFNTSKAWINNGTKLFRQSAIVKVTDGVGEFSVGAFDNETYSNVTTELNATVYKPDPAYSDKTVTSNSTVVDFWAPSQLAYITGDYRKAEGGLLYESEVGGVWISVRSDDTGIVLYSYLDVVNDAGYTVRVPLGNYTVLGDAKYYQAATATVAVDQPDRTFTADLVFVSDRKPSTIYIGYGHYTSADDMLNDINNGTLVKSKTNVATGDENDYEELTILVLDQYNDPISATVTVTIELPGDLQVDGKYTTTTAVTVGTNGLGYVYVTCFGANETAKATYGPIATVNITAALSTNPSINDTATKTYVWKGNSSIFGQVYWVNEETGEKAPAVGAKVWAVYAGMSNHSLSYIEDIMPWMVDTVDEHGVYVLDGIAVGEHNGTDVFIYVIYPGWNGINDTVPGLLASQGELDPAVEGSRGGCTGMYIAAAEYQNLRYDGDTENHDIKLDNPEPIDYEINLTEDAHYLTFNGTGYDKTTITITLVYYSEANPSEKYPAANRLIKVNVTGVDDALLATKDGQIGKEVWVTTDENGTATLTFYAGTTEDVAVVTAYFDTKTDDQGVISASGEKHIVKTGSISFDVCDQTGAQLDWLAREGRIIAVLWMDNTTSNDGVFNPDNDWIIAANLVDPLSGFATKDNYAALLDVKPPFDTLEIFKVVHGVPGDRLKNPFNIPVMPFNARYVAKDGHASFDGVVPEHRYYVEAIVVKPGVTTLNESVVRMGYAVVDKQAGTDTADVYVYIPSDWKTQPSETTAAQLKQQILNLIIEYTNNPSEELKQQILELILKYTLLI